MGKQYYVELYYPNTPRGVSVADELGHSTFVDADDPEEIKDLVREYFPEVEVVCERSGGGGETIKTLRMRLKEISKKAAK